MTYGYCLYCPYYEEEGYCELYEMYITFIKTCRLIEKNK